MEQRETTRDNELRRWASVEWLAQHLRRLSEYGVRTDELPPKVEGKPLATETRSRYRQTDNILQVAACALCTRTRYARFATAQRNAFFNIGGYLLTGAESDNAEARRLHPRRQRAETTPPELAQRDARGGYAALHHVLGRFADRRMTLGHGPGWQQRVEDAMGPADLPDFLSVEEIGWTPPDPHTARLADDLIKDLSAALGPKFLDGPAATSAEAAEAEAWRRWPGTARGLETRAAAGGLMCRRRSPMSGKSNVRLIPITESAVETWLGSNCIQAAMPHVSASDREFILSGTLPEEWDTAMEALGADTE